MEKLLERFSVDKWNERHFAVRDNGDLVAVTEYRKGAEEVRRRMIAYEMAIQGFTEERSDSKEGDVRRRPENLTFPGMKARRFPDKAKKVDMSAWTDSPLYKASVRAEVEKVQGVLLDKKASSRCEQRCPGCGVTYSPDIEHCPIEVFDDYKLGIDLDYDEYDILQRRRERDEGLRPGKQKIAET
jgi:hypothetical protein